MPVGLSVTAIFAALSALHLYWALGGGRGLKKTIPELDGKPLFRPGVGATLVVAVLLAVAAMLVLERTSVGPGVVPPVASLWGTRGVAVVLTARAVGDFNYVGFFKLRRTTAFARLDTWLYSPLALALGVGAGIVGWSGG